MGKMIELGGGKNAQGVMITITIVKFVWISDYGTYTDIFGWRKEVQYIVKEAKRRFCF